MNMVISDSASGCFSRVLGDQKELKLERVDRGTDLRWLVSERPRSIRASIVLCLGKKTERESSGPSDFSTGNERGAIRRPKSTSGLRSTPCY